MELFGLVLQVLEGFKCKGTLSGGGVVVFCDNNTTVVKLFYILLNYVVAILASLSVKYLSFILSSFEVFIFL